MARHRSLLDFWVYLFSLGKQGVFWTFVCAVQLIFLAELSLSASYMEIGSVTINTTIDQGGWVSVSVQGIYTNPVIVTGPVTHNNDNTLSVRIRNKTTTGFEIGLQSPCESLGVVALGVTCPSSWLSEEVNYIVIEAGNWTLDDGTQLTAGLSNINSVRSEAGDLNESQTVFYGRIFNTRPMVFHTVNTFNDSVYIASAIWEAGFGISCNSNFDDRTDPPGLLSMCMALEAMETATTHGAETVGWLAIESGNAQVDIYDFNVGSGTITRHDGCTGLSGFSFSQVPLVIGAKLTANGIDGSVSRFCGQAKTSSSIYIHADEDQTNDEERIGGTEIFGFLVFPEAAVVKIDEPNLVAYYSYDGVGGQAIYDGSGNQLNGTLGETDAVGSDDPSNVCNGYLYFNSTSDLVRVDDNTLLDLTSEYSISAWFHTDWNPLGNSGDEIQTIVSKGNNYSIQLIDNGFFYETWRFRWSWRSSAGDDRVFETNSLYLEDDRWYHAVFTFENGAQKVYLDGALIGDSASFSETVTTNNEPLYMGATSSPANNFFSGFLDEIRIYDGVLDTNEIAEVSQAYDNCAPTRKLAYFDFDYTVLQGVANEIEDKTQNNLGLTPIGGAMTAEFDRANPASPGTCEYLNLDGVDDFVQSADSATELQVFNDYAVAFWIKSASVQKNFAAIYTKTNVGGTENHWTLQQDGSTGNLAVFHGDNSWDTTLDISDIAGQWHHVAIVRSGSAQSVYLDGALHYVSTFNVVPGNGDGYLNIGADRTGSATFAWAGQIDELNVYDYAITSSAVSNLYNETHSCQQAFSSCSFNVRDEFSVVSYTQNDGTQPFSGGWVEDDDSQPNSGDILISAGQLQYQASSGTASIDRGINLNQSDNPKLSFKVSSTNTEGSGFFADYVEVYTSDGNGFQLLERIDTLSGTDTTTRTYNLAGYASENSAIRFNFNTNNSNEIFYIDNVDIRPYCAAAQYLDIQTDGSASTCAPEEITLRICQQADCTSVATGFTGTVTLSTSTSNGTWSIVSANGTLTDLTTDDGAATYTFVSADMGQVTLALSNTHADILKINAIGSDLVTDTSDSLTFLDNVLRMTPNYDSGHATAIAGKNLDVTIDVVARDGAVCQVVPCSGSFTLAANATHNTSMGPSSPATPTLAGASLPSSGTQPVTLNFVNGSVDTQLNLNNIGHFVVNLTDTNSGCRKDENNNPLTITGNSDNIIVKPFALRLNNEPANPIVAQTAFNLDVEGVLWASADDANNDGTPDVNADLSDNTLASLFGDETQAQNVSVSLVETWPLNAAATEGQLTSGVTNSDSGRYQMSLAYSEVGEIQIQADVEEYLGSNDDLTVSTPNQWRRFHPAYLQFSINNVPTLAARCISGNYSYLGQILSYGTLPIFEIAAFGSSDNAVNNYKESYFNWSPNNSLSAGTDYSVTDAGSTVGVPTLGFGAQTWSIISNSTSDYAVNSQYSVDHNFQYTKGITPQAAFVPLPEIVWQDNLFVDSDGVCFLDNAGDSACNALSMSVNAINNTLKFGRIAVENSSGPVNSHLEIKVNAEYWNSGQGTFVMHVDDSCTQIDSSNFSLSNYTGSLNSGDVAFNNIIQTLQAGQLNVILLKIDSSNSGSVDYSLDLDALGLNHLNYNWESSGSEVNPRGRATFGVYRGHDRIIFWEEMD